MTCLHHSSSSHCISRKCSFESRGPIVTNPGGWSSHTTSCPRCSLLPMVVWHRNIAASCGPTMQLSLVETRDEGQHPLTIRPILVILVFLWATIPDDVSQQKEPLDILKQSSSLQLKSVQPVEINYIQYSLLKASQPSRPVQLRSSTVCP